MEWNAHEPVFESDLLNSYLSTSPWVGHRNFAYDLLSFFQPQRVVELGTHYGCSFFAFAQAVKDLLLPTQLFAIDTWQGDEHAGQYDESVYKLVNETINEFYSQQDIILKRMYFEEALKDFEDESIDIIHVDGLHTYEAVSLDFKNWLPKLKKDGIMLFHDIASYTNYGSHFHWEEIKKEYPHFEFEHSWGLGVLFPKGNLYYNVLKDQNFDDKIKSYFYKAKFEYSQHQIRDLEKMATERYEAIQRMEGIIMERDDRIEADTKLLEDRYNSIRNMDKLIKKKENESQADKLLLTQRYKAILEMERIIKEKEEHIKGDAKLLEERYSAMEEMRRVISSKNEELNRFNIKLKEFYSLIEEKNQVIKKYKENLSSKKFLLKKLIKRG